MVGYEFFGTARALIDHLDPPPMTVEPFDNDTAGFFSTLWGEVKDDRKHVLQTVSGSSGRILDVGSGDGRLVAELATSGHQVVGVELSPAMHQRAITRLRSSISQTKKHARLVCGDFRDLTLRRGSLAGVTSIGLTVPMFSDEVRRDLVDFAARSLSPGGVFVFDLLDVDDTNYASVTKVLNGYRGDDLRVVLIECVHDPATSSQVTNLIFQDVGKDGSTDYRVCSLSCRLPRRGEMISELEEAGFRNVRIERGATDEAVTAGSEPRWDLVYVTATKGPRSED